MGLNWTTRLKYIKTSFKDDMHLYKLIPTMCDYELLILIGLYLVHIKFNDVL